MQHIKRSRVTRFFVVPLTLVALFSGCYKWSMPGQRPADYIRAEEPSKVKLNLKNGRELVVKNPTATDSTISWSEGDSLAVVRLDQLWSLEERRFSHAKTWGFLGASLVVGTAALFAFAHAVVADLCDETHENFFPDCR